jgi:hypothetical protein
MPLNQSIAALFQCVTLGAALAQTTHLVGPTGYSSIGQAVEAASRGDLILVEPGTYPGFQVTKTLTIRARVPGSVNISGGMFNVVNLPPGETAHMVGLRIRHLTWIQGGTTALDQCEFRAAGDFLIIQNARIHMQDSAVLGNAIPPFGSPVASMIVVGSLITAIDSTFRGAGDQKAPFSTRAMLLSNSVLHASHCTFTAGLTGLPVPALEADASSRLWLSDSTVTCAPPTCPIVTSGATGRLARCVLTPQCLPLPVGPLLGLTRPAPMTPGGPFSLHFRNEPHAILGVLAAWSLDRFAGPLHEQFGLLGPGYAAVGLLIADSVGAASATWQIPANPALLYRPLWLQGVTGMSLPLQLSPVAGGVLR